MEALKKAIENRKVPFEVEGKAGGRVISLRVSERMEQLLEEQAQEWNMSISDTLRGILNFYFLPPLLLEAWERKVEELVDLEGESKADKNGATQSQRTEEILVDSEEAEEYAQFIHELWDKSLSYFETLRNEASTMNKIAEERLLKTAEALRKAGKKLEKERVEA